jgi:hypothetical protein
MRKRNIQTLLGDEVSNEVAQAHCGFGRRGQTTRAKQPATPVIEVPRGGWPNTMTTAFWPQRGRAEVAYVSKLVRSYDGRLLAR